MQNPTQAQRNPYMVLGLKPNADKEELKAAYRELAKMHHPDCNPDSPLTAAQKMKEIKEAWETVGEPARRKEYDAMWMRLRVPREVGATSRKGEAPPSPGLLARLFGLRPKDGPGSPFHAYFTAAMTCFQYPGGKLMEQAERELRQALRVKPDAWEARFDLGLVCYWQGKYAEALVFFKEVQRQFPDDAACRRMAEALLPSE